MRLRLAAAFLVLSAGGFGCSAILGLTAGSPEDTDGGLLDATTGFDAASDGGQGGCTQGQKSCGGKCVDPNDPAYGCGATTCTACNGPNVTAFTCSSGACVVQACGAGLGDCDKNAANGCETNTTTGANCGKCGAPCPTDVPICAGSTCITAGSCDGSVCGTSCVDTTGSVHNCGSCSTDCTNPEPPGTTATCTNSKCNYACAAGAQDCNGNLADGCECTTGCNGGLCCPAGGCVPPDGGGVDSSPPFDSGPPPTEGGSGCATGGACNGPQVVCTTSSQCCCPLTCNPSGLEPIPFGIPDASLGNACCVTKGQGLPAAACSGAPNPCCPGLTCIVGGSGAQCM